MKSLLKPLTKSVLIPFALTIVVSATDAAIQKNIFGPGMTTLIISNEEMRNHIMKIIKSLQDPSLLIKGVSETIENETEEQKVDFLRMFLGALGASLLRNLLTGKGVKQLKIPGRGETRAGEGTIRLGGKTIRTA